MKKVGFIDYYLDEWHAKEYPKKIFNQSGGEYKVTYAYGKIDCPFQNSMTNSEWAKKYDVQLLSSIEEVVEKSDCLIVLSPDNAEMHYELSECALKSGKPVFIDKTFSESKADAERIFAVGEQNSTPCFSSSSLRYSNKLNNVDRNNILSIVSVGGGHPENYLVHQLEPISVLMGYDFERVMFIGTTDVPSWVMQFEDGRTVLFTLAVNAPFALKICYTNRTDQVVIDDDFFFQQTERIIEMFDTGKIPVQHAETIAIMSARESCIKSMSKPFEWINIE